jgi:hypothetical protein
MRHEPNKLLLKSVESGSFPLATIPVYRKHGMLLMEREYNRCEEFLSRKMPNEFNSRPSNMLYMKMTADLMQLIKDIKEREAPFQEELNRLAECIVRDMYNVPDYVNLKATLDSSGEDSMVDYNQDVQQVEVTQEMEREIQKRMILNGFVHGSSMHIWKSAHYIIAERLGELDGGLIDMYDKYVAAGGFLMWMMPPKIDMVVEFTKAMQAAGHNTDFGMTQGHNQVSFEKPGDVGATVTGVGVNFSVLIQEMNKGVMDYLITRAVPSHFSEQQLQYYYAKADDYATEQWYYYMAPAIWADLLDSLKVTSQELPAYIMRMCNMELEELNQFCESLVENKERAKELIG